MISLNKNIFYSFYRYLFFLLIIFYLFACSEDGPTNPGNQNSLSDKITVGTETQEITQEIGTGGGKIIISNTGSVLNGMEIIVPEKGYNENRTYIITSSPITNHKLGEYFNPASPMITINNGGGYSKMPITIKVPIVKNDDEFLMGFLFNEITGELEALPVIELDDNFITVETRHFALSKITSGNGLGKISDINPIANLVISSIIETILTGQNVISSGFTPGIDDWEFINYGSYISPGGHCAGQSMTAMWYYYEKKLKGEPSLFHRFDLVNSSEKPLLLWQDNPRGYRFASTIQEDADWGKWVKALKLQSKYPSLVWKTFITAMLVTGEPQSVIIRNSVSGGGHAMIVYKINIPEGKLFIADPNYPNNRSTNGTYSLRTITYLNDKFQPYPSFAKAGDPGVEYDQIAFYTKTSTFDWVKIGERYKEMEEKTIGNDRFKKYDLYVKTNTENILFFEGMDMTESTLKLFCRNDNIPGFLPGTDRLQRIEIYDSNGNYIAVSDANGIANINLNSGENTFGIYICGYLNGKPNKYYDFKWVTVNHSGITPPDYNRCGIQIDFGGRYHYTTPDTAYVREDEGYTESTWLSYPGSFSGTSFTASYSRTWDSQYNPLVITGTINATFNNDFTTISNISWTENRNSNTTTFVGTDIPLDTYEWGTVYQIETEETCDHITTLTDVQNVADGLSWTLPVYWCNGDSKIYISFSKE